MSLRHRLSVAGVLALGLIAVFAIGASGASATSVPGNPVAFKAFVDNGFDATIVGVTGGNVRLACSGQEGNLTLRGTQSNGMAKSMFHYENGYNNVDEDDNDDLDTGDSIAMNWYSDVIGHAEFINGSQTKSMTVNYATENAPPNSTADCSAWGSVVKGTF